MKNENHDSRTFERIRKSERGKSDNFKLRVAPLVNLVRFLFLVTLLGPSPPRGGF